MAIADPSALPNDVEELKALVLEREHKIAQLEQENRLLRKWAFAAKSERRPQTTVDPEQFQGSLLFPELIEAAERVADETGQSGRVELDSTGLQRRKPRRRTAA